MKITFCIYKTIVALSFASFSIVLLWFFMIMFMTSYDETKQILVSPSGNVIAVKIFEHGFADSFYKVNVKQKGFLQPKHTLGPYGFIFDMWWDVDPEVLNIKYTEVFSNNEPGVYVQRCSVDGVDLGKELIGIYKHTSDNRHFIVVPLEVNKRGAEN